MPLPTPKLCRLLTRPLAWLPQRLHSGGLALALNRILAEQLAGGELDFLRGKTVSLSIDDLGVRHRLSLGTQGFGAAPHDAPDDVRFSGELYTFLLLATQREDADSLFFQRRLRIQGDTATGLHLKNFIDALGEPPLPAALHRTLQRATDLYARYCADEAATAAAPLTPSAGPLR